MMDVWEASARLYHADPEAFSALIGHLRQASKIAERDPPYNYARALGSVEGAIIVAGCVIPKPPKLEVVR